MDNVYSMGTVGRDNPHALLADGKDFTGVLKMVYSLLWVICGCNSGHKPLVETGYYHAAWQIGTLLFRLLRDHSPKQIFRWVLSKKKKKGIGQRLPEHCIEDTGKLGVVMHACNSKGLSVLLVCNQLLDSLILCVSYFSFINFCSNFYYLLSSFGFDLFLFF